MFSPVCPGLSGKFPQDYFAARQAFLNALQQQTCACQHEAVLYPACGRQGEALYTDIAWLGAADADNVLVLISATHGVEGFAGSAIQTDVLGQLAHTRLPDNLAVVMIYALNPWGFAWERRVNENGVDLNRNSVDFSQPLPATPDYDLLADALVPQDSDWETAQGKLLAYMAGWSQGRIRRGIAGGQYTHPHGLFYGGDKPAFSRQLVERKLAEWQLDQRQVVVLDLHTALGSFGHGELICDHPADSLASRKAQAWFGGLVSVPESGNSCSVPLVGLMDYLWHAAMREDGLFLTLEYGTYPFEALLDALRHEHWLYQQTRQPDFIDPVAQAIRSRMREVFNPASAVWQECVLLRARQVVRIAWQCLQGLAVYD
jgi:hypothetical protein